MLKKNVFHKYIIDKVNRLILILYDNTRYYTVMNIIFLDKYLSNIFIIIIVIIYCYISKKKIPSNTRTFTNSNNNDFLQ